MTIEKVNEQLKEMENRSNCSSVILIKELK